MPLAADEERIARPQRIDADEDRLGAVAHLFDARFAPRLSRPRHDGRTDRGRIFAAGIVVGDDHMIGASCRGRAHQGPLATIPIAAGTDNRDDPAQNVRTDRLERGFHRVGRMGVIDIDRGAILAGGGKLHPATDGREPRERMEDLVGIAPSANRQRRRDRHVRGLKPAYEFEADNPRLAFIDEPKRLTGGIEMLPRKAEIGPFAMAHGDHRMARRAGDLGLLCPARIVKIDDRRALRRQNAGEKAHLGGEIGPEGLVIVEVVLGEIRKRRSGQLHTVEPALVEPVARSLHRHVGDTRLGGLGHDLVQGDRLGRGVAQRVGPCPFNAGCADVHRLLAHILPDLATEG